MLPFEDYWKEAANTPNVEYVNIQTVDIGRNVLIDSDILISELQQLDQKNDQDIYKLIGLSYKIILDIDFINKDKNKIHLARAFLNARFVGIFCQVIGTIQLTDIQKVCCNKLIYDYFTMSSNKDDYIMNLLYTLGWNINSSSVATLYGKGLNQQLITYLAVARYSTTDERLAVKRVNVIIINQPLTLMTEQLIVNIYEEFFNKSLLALFEGIMFDAWDYDSLENELDDDQEEIYDTINLAILDILNDMPLDMVVSIMKSYAQTKQYCHNKESTRFDIHSISADYFRVSLAIQMAESEGVFVPH